MKKNKYMSMVYLSDYAHHPAEIRQSILSIKQLYEGRRIKAIFQPHLYTRTRDFYRDFADALSLLDDVAIVDIYPAREQPIPGVTSRLIYDNLRPGIKKQLCTKDEICDIVRQGGFDVLVTLELIIDSRTIRELQEDNHRLRLLNEQISAEKNVEIIEINDNRAQPESYFTPF